MTAFIVVVPDLYMLLTIKFLKSRFFSKFIFAISFIVANKVAQITLWHRMWNTQLYMKTIDFLRG